MSKEPATQAKEAITATATASTNATATARPRTVLPKPLPVPKPLSDGAAGPGFAALNALTAGLDVARTDGEAALARIEHLLEAIAEEDVIPRVNVNVRNTAIGALGVLSRILAIRPDAERYAPNHDLIYLDNLEDILLAMLQADMALQMSAEDRKELATKAEPLFAKRDEYASLAYGFAKFRIIDMSQLEAVGKEAGYKALARDLEILVAAFRQAWPRIGSSLPFTQQELAQLSRDATALNVAIGIKEQNPTLPREANLLRRRVLTLFRLAEDDLRRLASGLYGEDAVDSIIPRFSNSPKGSRPKGEPGVEAEDSSTENLTSAPSSPSAAQTSSSALRPSGFIINNPENLPITPPFIEEDDAQKESA